MLQPKDGALSCRWHDRGGSNRHRHDRSKYQLRVVSLKLQRHCTGRSRKLKLYDFTWHFPIPEPAHPRLSLAADVDWFHRHWTRERSARDEQAIASPVPRRPFRHGVPAVSIAAAHSRCNSQSLQHAVVATRSRCNMQSLHCAIVSRSTREPAAGLGSRRPGPLGAKRKQGRGARRDAPRRRVRPGLPEQPALTYCFPTPKPGLELVRPGP